MSSQAEGERRVRGRVSRPSGPQPMRIGGMALGNGLFVHSARNWAAAVRGDDGAIRVASGAKRFPRAGDDGRVPLVRGLARLADGLLVLLPLKRALPEAVLPFEEPRVQAAVGVAALAGLGTRTRGGNPVSREVRVLVASLAPLLLALRGSELAAYHGAEHKSIGEYELGVLHERPDPSSGSASAGSSESAAIGSSGSAVVRPQATKEHERCGSNVVGPLLATSLVSNVAMRTFVRKPGPAAALVSGVASMGAALEVFRWMTRHPDKPLSRALALPGHWLQETVTTREPSDAQMEVARAALSELLSLEQSRQS